MTPRSKFPPYFKQERSSTCTLAVLRMVLSHFGTQVPEDTLRDEIVKMYGPHFKNVWNPTIARLAVQYGIGVKLYAMWPLLKRDVFDQAVKEFKEHGVSADVTQFENPRAKSDKTEPLSLGYTEMFHAAQAGVEYEYAACDSEVITAALEHGSLILTTVKLDKLYPDSGRSGYHGVLIYAALPNGSGCTYHDPAYGEALNMSWEHFEYSQDTERAGIVFSP